MIIVVVCCCIVTGSITSLFMHKLSNLKDNFLSLLSYCVYIFGHLDHYERPLSCVWRKNVFKPFLYNLNNLFLNCILPLTSKLQQTPNHFILAQDCMQCSYLYNDITSEEAVIYNVTTTEPFTNLGKRYLIWTGHYKQITGNGCTCSYVGTCEWKDLHIRVCCRCWYHVKMKACPFLMLVSENLKLFVSFTYCFYTS